MPLNNDFFTPEKIDKQIEDLSSPSLQTDQLQVRDRKHMRLMQHLRRFYRTNTEDDAHTLNSAWERITHERMYTNLRIHEKEQVNEMRSLTEHTLLPTKNKIVTSRKISIMAAVLLMAVLVGSMILMLNHAHQNSGLGNNTKITLPHKPAGEGQLNLYASDFASVYKIDRQTGKKVWVFDTPSKIMQAPIVSNGVVYFASGNTNANSYVYALNASNGALRWKAAHYSSVFTVSDGIVYAAYSDADNTHIDLATLDANTGDLHWRYNPGLQVSSAMISNGVLYGTGLVDTTPLTGVLFAMRVPEGAPILWLVKIQGQLFNPPQIVDNVVYATSSRDNTGAMPVVNSSYAYAFDAQTGAQIWRTPEMNAYVMPTMPAVSHGVMYIISDTNTGISTLYALHSNDGTVIWHKFIDGDARYTPLAINGNVYIGIVTHSDVTQILALKAVDGSKLWLHSLVNPAVTVFGAILVASPNAIYASTLPSQVIALSLDNGSQLQVYQVPDRPHDQDSSLYITLAP